MEIKSDMMGGDYAAAEAVGDLIQRALGLEGDDAVDDESYQAAMTIAHDTRLSPDDRITAFQNLWDEDGTFHPAYLEKIIELVPQMSPRYLDPQTQQWVDGAPPSDLGFKQAVQSKAGPDDKVDAIIRSFPKRPTNDQVLDLYQQAKTMRSNKLMNFVKRFKMEGMPIARVIGVALVERLLSKKGSHHSAVWPNRSK